MIQEFVDRFMASQDALRAEFQSGHPEDYAAIVRAVVEAVRSKDDDAYEEPDPNRIHCINDGDYQGTMLFLIGADDYQPSKYWFIRVGYGSCSGCDTLEAIRGYSDEPPTEDQVRDYMTLALHVVQGLQALPEGGDA